MLTEADVMLRNPGSVWFFKTKIVHPGANVPMIHDVTPEGDAVYAALFVPGDIMVVLGQTREHRGMTFLRVLREDVTGWIYLRNAPLFERVDG